MSSNHLGPNTCTVPVRYVCYRYAITCTLEVPVVMTDESRESHFRVPPMRNPPFLRGRHRSWGPRDHGGRAKEGAAFDC